MPALSRLNQQETKKNASPGLGEAEWLLQARLRGAGAAALESQPVKSWPVRSGEVQLPLAVEHELRGA